MTSMAIIRIFPRTARAVEYGIVHVCSHTGPVRSVSQCVVHAAMAGRVLGVGA